MIYLTAATPILVATAPADFRRGIDGFVARATARYQGFLPTANRLSAPPALCEQHLGVAPRDGTLYVFRNRASTMVRILAYETSANGHGSGYWLLTKRLSRGRFRDWPAGGGASNRLAAHRLRQLLNAMLDSGDD